MTNIEIKRVTGEDYFSQARTIAGYAFRASPYVPDTSGNEEALKFLEKSRAYVVFGDEQPLATATLFPMVENVRGKLLSMSGVGGVATMPAARRKGYVRDLFGVLYASMRENGESVSTLYPFRDSFYERLGYAAMPQARFVRFAPSTLLPTGKIEKQGYVEQTMIADGFDDWRAYLERYQERVHGFALNELSIALQQPNRNQEWLALARDARGTVFGGMTFRITGYGKELEVDSFYYDSPEARLLLLDWFARHIDQVNEIVIRIGPAEAPDLWFRDLYPRIRNHDVYYTPPMGRVMDIDALVGISVGAGSIAIDLVDDQCAWNSGIYTLADSGGGTLVIERGGRPSTRLTIQGLSALVFAGHDPGDFRIRGWGDPDSAAQATLRSLFPPAFPHLHEAF